MGVQHTRRRSALIAAVVCQAGLSLLWVGHARAAVLVNDTWKDGTDGDPASAVYSENGVDSDGDGDIESAWYQGGVGSLDPVGAGGPLRGNMTAGGASSASWTTYFTPESGQVTLAKNESLRVTWTFSLTNVNANNTSQNFRLALTDTPAAARLTANGAPGSAVFTGYAMFMNMGVTLGNSNPFRVMERTNGAVSDILGTSGNWAGIGTTGATSGNHGYDSGTSYTFVMTLTHNALDGMDIVSTMTGGTLNGSGAASVTVTDAAANGFTYDTFAVRPSGATSTAELFDTSLFKVEYILAPEPSSLSVIAVGGLAMLRRRQRSRD